LSWLGVNVIFEAAMLSFFLTNTLMMQIGLGFSPIHAALTGLPVAFASLYVWRRCTTVVPKLGRYSITIETVIMGFGLAVTSWVLHRYGLAVHSWQFIPGLLLVVLAWAWSLRRSCSCAQRC